ncbi:MAG: hypothetical protein P4M13_07760 [Alphaproteobacteria bacterium]|nr:hypothetical protein [Alphaproteobacteria bacterium]
MKKKTEARRVGAMLTVGFHTAYPPLIWRFDLERNHSFTLSLQGDGGDWELGVTTPKGDFYPVAHFAERSEAEEALTQIEKVLAKNRGVGAFILKSVVFIAVLAVLVGVGASLVGLALSHHSTGPIAARLAPAAPQDGEPQAADDILQPPP